MSVVIKGTTIYATRGDTITLKFPFTMNGAEYTPSGEDVLRFALNTEEHEDEPLITKVISNETGVLILEPEDTKDLEFGTYYYDVQITFGESGLVRTFIPEKPNQKAKFILGWEAD